jgi:hypothetical protein
MDYDVRLVAKPASNLIDILSRPGNTAIAPKKAACLHSAFRYLHAYPLASLSCFYL